MLSTLPRGTRQAQVQTLVKPFKTDEKHRASYLAPAQQKAPPSGSASRNPSNPNYALCCGALRCTKWYGGHGPESCIRHSFSSSVADEYLF
jgi:hypothetical protein